VIFRQRREGFRPDNLLEAARRVFLTSANDRRYIIGVVERRDFNVLSVDSSRREKRKVLSLKIYFTKMLFREVLLYHFMPIILKV
jgi:hypothetical protein